MHEESPNRLTDEELRRDQRVYRTLKRKGMTEDQRARLFGLVRCSKGYTAAAYRRYQSKLIYYGRDAGIRTTVLPKDRRPLRRKMDRHAIT